MLRIRQRIELLEEALLPVDEGPPLLLEICGVDEDGKVVETRVLKVPQFRPKAGRDRWGGRVMRRRAHW